MLSKRDQFLHLPCQKGSLHPCLRQ